MRRHGSAVTVWVPGNRSDKPWDGRAALRAGALRMAESPRVAASCRRQLASTRPDGTNTVPVTVPTNRAGPDARRKSTRRNAQRSVVLAHGTRSRPATSTARPNGYVTGPGGRGWVTARGHPAIRSAFAARASATAMDGHALHSLLRARPHAIEGAYCPSPDERSQPPRTSRPVNRSHNPAVNRDRWRRDGAFAASIAEHARHGASYNPLSERTIQNPYPVYARLRRNSPVHRSVILGSWILSRYDDVLAVARDHERFSNDPRWRNTTASVLPPAPDDYSILLVNPPEHT